MKTIRLVTLAAALLATTPLAWTHDDATLDTLKSANGGQVRAAGPLHFELVVAAPGKDTLPGSVLVFVTDHAGGKKATAGATGTVILLSGGKKTTITLTPDTDNRMKGEGPYLASTDMKGIVSIALAGVPAESARFTPLARNEPGSRGVQR